MMTTPRSRSPPSGPPPGEGVGGPGGFGGFGGGTSALGRMSRPRSRRLISSMTYASSIATSPETSLMATPGGSRCPFRTGPECLQRPRELHAGELLGHPVDHEARDQRRPGDLDVDGVAREGPAAVLGELP